jgi:hypothetical protein
MRWAHVSFNLEDVVALVAGSAIFVLFMGWLDRYKTPTEKAGAENGDAKR